MITTSFHCPMIATLSVLESHLSAIRHPWIFATFVSLRLSMALERYWQIPVVFYPSHWNKPIFAILIIMVSSRLRCRCPRNHFPTPSPHRPAGEYLDPFNQPFLFKNCCWISCWSLFELLTDLFQVSAPIHYASTSRWYGFQCMFYRWIYEN